MNSTRADGFAVLSTREHPQSSYLKRFFANATDAGTRRQDKQSYSRFQQCHLRPKRLQPSSLHARRRPSLAACARHENALPRGQDLERLQQRGRRERRIIITTIVLVNADGGGVQPRRQGPLGVGEGASRIALWQCLRRVGRVQNVELCAQAARAPGGQIIPGCFEITDTRAWCTQTPCYTPVLARSAVTHHQEFGRG